MTSTVTREDRRAARVVGIVDDDADLREATAVVLEHEGFNVREYSSGEEFLSSGAKHDLAGVILDLQLSGRTGLDVLQRIRHEPAIIFTTAYDRYAVAAFELQAVDYLLKPFGRERLARALERIVPDGESAASRARTRSWAIWR